MKLLNELESENAPLFADILCNSLLSSGQRTFEYSQCHGHVPVTSVGTIDITLVPVIATTVVANDTITEQHESKDAFTPIVNDIPTGKMTLASSVRVQHLTLPRSASDSKLFIGIEPQPELELDNIQSYDVDELSRVTADIAAENPDMIRFQQVLNSWVSIYFKFLKIIINITAVHNYRRILSYMAFAWKAFEECCRTHYDQRTGLLNNILKLFSKVRSLSLYWTIAKILISEK